MKKTWVGSMLLVSLWGCTTTGETELDTQVAALTTCEKIDALIKGHKHGFPNLRTTQSSAKIMDVWKARYHLVGDSCQVWGWGAARFSYVCTLTEPGQDLAMEHFNQAKAKTRECLSPQWALQEGPRDNGEGVKAEFSKPGEKTVVTLVAASSPTVFKTEWKTYYFVGDPNDIR